VVTGRATIGICLALALATHAGCASRRPATQVTIFVDAEPLTRAETRRLEIVVRGGPPGTTLLDAGDPIVFTGPFAWPYDVTVTPAGDDATRLFELEATSYDAGHRVVSQARLRAAYVVRESRTVRVVLQDACRGVVCPPDRACRDGRCEPIMMPIDQDAGVPGPDADGGHPTCAADGDCDDHNACNGTEFCAGGACRNRGDRLDCDDHVACTVDACDGRDCVHTATPSLCTMLPGGTCDPVNDCQYGACSAATCVSNGCQSAACMGAVCVRTFACGANQTCCGGACVPTGCDDGETCTMDYCDTASSTCRHDPQNVACDDHDPCTTIDTCTAGACVGTMPRTCDDGQLCTSDSCQPGVGCVSVANSLPCSDGNPCTVGDQCGSNTCQPGMPMLCDDSVACTVDSCGSGGTCAHVPSDALCGAGTCDPTLGCQTGATCDATACAASAGPCETATCSGTTCVHSGCAAGTACCGGSCMPMGCSDGNPCTDDACGASGCFHTFNVIGCDDGDACTSGDTCGLGVCHGTVMSCDDLNVCTTDACSGGACTHTPLSTGACDDANECTFVDHCVAGVCRGTRCPTGTLCCNLGACVRPTECL
jgi:hypothetical protein